MKQKIKFEKIKCENEMRISSGIYYTKGEYIILNAKKVLVKKSNLTLLLYCEICEI